MPFNIINKYLSTFNLFLIFVGYQLVTSLFLPNYTTYDGTEGGLNVTRVVTVPYRIMALSVSFLVIILNWKQKMVLNLPLKLYFIFWFFLGLRIVYDLEIRSDIIINTTRATEELIYILFVCVIPVVAFYRSISVIDYLMAFKWIFAAYIILIPVFAYNNPVLFATINPGVRFSGNVAMNTITFGHYGVTLAILAFYRKELSRNIWVVLGCYILIAIGAFVMLRSGSRGPLIALFGCFIFYYMARQKSSALAVFFMSVVITILMLGSNYIMNVISQLSPVMAGRFSLSGSAIQYEELSKERLELYQRAIDNFANRPFFGDSFSLFAPDGNFIYSHNIILDAFMGMGFFGGVLFVIILVWAIKRAYRNISFQYQHWWLSLICIQAIISHMFSGCFYRADTLNVLLLFLFAQNYRSTSFIKSRLRI